jgi:hypothetical protein
VPLLKSADVRIKSSPGSKGPEIPPSGGTAATAAGNPAAPAGRAADAAKGATSSSSVAGEIVRSSSFPAQSQDPYGGILFCDLCGGPGGFSMFLIERLGRSNCRGVGFTLKTAGGTSLDWSADLEKHGNIFSVCWGADGSGDIFYRENRSFLSKEIKEICLKQKYLLRLKNSINTFAPL